MLRPVRAGSLRRRRGTPATDEKAAVRGQAPRPRIPETLLAGSDAARSRRSTAYLRCTTCTGARLGRSGVALPGCRHCRTLASTASPLRWSFSSPATVGCVRRSIAGRADRAEGATPGCISRGGGKQLEASHEFHAAGEKVEQPLGEASCAGRDVEITDSPVHR